MLLVLANAPGHPQDLALAHPNVQIKYLSSTLLHSSSCSASESLWLAGAFTLATPYALSWMPVRRRRLLVSVNAGNYKSIADCIVNIKQLVDDLKSWP